MPCQNTNVTQSAIAAMGIIPLTIQASPAGRLAHFQSNWEKVTKDRWVLNSVKWYEIEFSLKPHQTQKPYPAQLNQTQQELVSQEIKDMISKGAVTELQTLPVGGFLSTLFLVPKKDGGQRPVINLKKLNSFINASHFKMEDIHTLKSLLQKGRLASKDRPERGDLKDAYFSVPISKEQRKFLCFQFRDRFYQFNCLPFGLASAPWVFTKTLKPIAALGRELGIRLIVYIDDILLMAETEKKARDQASGLIYLLQCLGFTVNIEKTVLDPSQYLEFLGFMVDTTKMELSLPAPKNKKDSGGVPTDIRGGACNSPHPLQIDWQNECHKPGDPTSSSVLQEPTNGPDNGSKESRPGLRDTSQSIP